MSFSQILIVPVVLIFQEQRTLNLCLILILPLNTEQEMKTFYHQQTVCGITVHTWYMGLSVGQEIICLVTKQQTSLLQSAKAGKDLATI